MNTNTPFGDSPLCPKTISELSMEETFHRAPAYSPGHSCSERCTVRAPPVSGLMVPCGTYV